MTDDLAGGDDGVVRPGTMTGVLSDAFQRAGLTTDARLVRFAEVLAEEFVEDQYARLEEAGSQPEERIRLSQVFVDLGVTAHILAIDHDVAEEPLWATQLLIDPGRLDVLTASPLKYEEPSRARCGRRVLLVGAPGGASRRWGNIWSSFTAPPCFGTCATGLTKPGSFDSPVLSGCRSVQFAG